MAMTETKPATGAETDHAPARSGPGELERLVGTGDHRTIGRMFIGFSLMFSALALIGRTLHGVDVLTDNGVLGRFAAMTNLSSLVALLLIGAVPLLVGIAMVIVPLQVGSPAIAFPRAAALSLWGWLLAAGVFVTSVALNGGIGGRNDAATRLGNVSTGAMLVALGLATVCVMTTVVAHRPLGMGLSKVPLFSWSMLVAGAIWLLSFGSAFAHVVVGQISHAGAAELLKNFDAGLSWLVRGPSIYMIAIPALGIAGDVVGRATGRRLANYFVFQTLIAAFAVLSFGAWAQTPSSARTIVWSLIALLIALPVLGMLGGLADALRHGSIRPDAALISSLLALLLLLGAAACGALQALDGAGSGQLIGFGARGMAVGQASFVIGAAFLGALAGLFGWSPQLWGRPSAGPAALGAVALTTLGYALLGTSGLVQAIVQIDGKDTAEAAFGAAAAAGGVLAVLGILGVISATLGAARAGNDEGAEELNGLTLEWSGAPLALDAAPIRSPYPLLDNAEEANPGKENA